jgi:antitoxin component of MazEF toxin-antitoxin module
MLKAKTLNSEAIDIPARLLKKLAIKDGTVVKAKIEKGKIFILKEEDAIATIMKYAGIWKDEEVDKVFREIRRDWGRWKENLSV